MQTDNLGLAEYAAENNECRDQRVSCLYKLAPGNVTKVEPLVCLKEMHKKHTLEFILLLLMACLPHVSFPFIEAVREALHYLTCVQKQRFSRAHTDF